MGKGWGERVRNYKGEGAVDSNSQKDTIRPGRILFLSNERERSCAWRGRGIDRDSEGRGVTFFKGAINFLSALVENVVQ